MPLNGPLPRTPPIARTPIKTHHLPRLPLHHPIHIHLVANPATLHLHLVLIPSLHRLQILPPSRPHLESASVGTAPSTLVRLTKSKSCAKSDITFIHRTGSRSGNGGRVPMSVSTTDQTNTPPPIVRSTQGASRVLAQAFLPTVHLFPEYPHRPQSSLTARLPPLLPTRRLQFLHRRLLPVAMSLIPRHLLPLIPHHRSLHHPLLCRHPLPRRPQPSMPHPSPTL